MRCTRNGDRVAPLAARRRARAPSRTRRAAARARGDAPAAPSTDRPHSSGRPTITARAPSASALSTSVPRRMPPSTITSSRSPTASTIAGSASAAGQHRVELAPAVVGDDDPAGAVLGGQHRVLGRQQALDDHRQRPVGGEALDVRPVEIGVGQGGELGSALVSLEAGLDGGGNEVRARLVGFGSGLALADAADRQVDGHDQRLVAVLDGLGDQLAGDPAVREHVQLKPARDLGDGLGELSRWSRWQTSTGTSSCRSRPPPARLPPRRRRGRASGRPSAR